MLTGALAYAARGIAVFPVDGKVPRTRHGLKDATTDETQIREWWARWPEAGIGMRTGSESGLLVLDVDPEHGGSEALAELQQEHGRLPETARCKTGGGGEHYYFRHPGGEVRNSAGQLGKGLDTRGDGGYVVAPPSRHSSGRPYVWDVDLDEVEPAEPPPWLLAALSERTNGLAPQIADALPEGGRNNELASLAGTMRARGMDEGAIQAALAETNRARCEPPLPDREVAAIAASISRYAANGRPAAPYLPTDPSGRRRFIPSRLAKALAEETPFAVGAESLYVYRSGVYRPGGEDDARQRVAQALGDDWKRSFAEEVVTYLRDTSPRLSDRPETERINFANGIFNRATGELEPHDPGLLTPLQIPVDFDPDAECPAAEEFMHQIQPDGDARRILYELVGYLMVPDNGLQAAFMMLGPGANGKSTLLALIGALLGEVNMSAIPLHRLEEDRFATAGLYGKLANIFADLDSRALASSSMFKAITGGDAIQAERKFRDAFSFKPYARLVFSANEPPPTPDGSEAFFRRWVIVPFGQSFAGREDRGLLARITDPTELSGLANLGLRHLGPLIERGHFSDSAATATAKSRFRVDSDTVAGFVEECCAVGHEERVPRPALHRVYTEWCKDANRMPLSAQRFNRRLVEFVGQGKIDVHPVQGIRTWHGIGCDGVR